MLLRSYAKLQNSYAFRTYIGLVLVPDRFRVRARARARVPIQMNDDDESSRSSDTANEFECVRCIVAFLLYVIERDTHPR